MISDSAVSLLPLTEPRVVIHTSTFDTGVGLVMVIVFDPVFIGVGGVSSVVSSSVAGVADGAERSWIDVPMLLRLSVTEPMAGRLWQLQDQPDPVLEVGEGNRVAVDVGRPRRCRVAVDGVARVSRVVGLTAWRERPSP